MFLFSVLSHFFVSFFSPLQLLINLVSLYSFSLSSALYLSSIISYYFFSLSYFFSHSFILSLICLVFNYSIILYYVLCHPSLSSFFRLSHILSLIFSVNLLFSVLFAQSIIILSFLDRIRLRC
jgi:hypothetical protein